ncbi:MAG: hypothetical protein PHC61_08755 [Chitinivibrionales bacterium]|nr:hypothetical protein [Chitinivibrionales bacterium]
MKPILRLAAVISVSFCLRAAALGAGDAAPDFTLTTYANVPLTLSQFQGEVRIVYFFSGCT